MKVGTIYSASDKALYDALNQRNVTNADLRQLFLTRGILISKDSSRKHVAKHFARLFHDYSDYQKLANLFGGAMRRDKIATVRIATEASLVDFQNAAADLKAELEDGGAVVRVSTAKGTRLDVEVQYSKVHFNQSEFRQVSTRTETISIFFENGGFVIHSPNSDDAKIWMDEMAKIVQEKTGKAVNFDEIRLPKSMDTKAKTAFFTRLIRNIQGFRLKDVSDVYVTKPKDWESDEEPPAGNPEIRIDKASLRGQGVLESDELKLLEKRGFYVSRIIWTGVPEGVPDPDIYEFEAQFSQPNECSDFTYLPRGFYRCLGPGSYNATRSNFSSEEEMKYGQMIEAAARETFNKLPGHDNG